jgi:hypothetical protein
VVVTVRDRKWILAVWATLAVTEELLLPLGRALAWYYCLDGPEGSAGRDEDAIIFLKALVRGDPPFDQPKVKITETMLHKSFDWTWPRVTIWPIIQLLKDLTVSQSSFDEIGSKIDVQEVAICMAEIHNTNIRIYPLQEQDFWPFLHWLGPHGIKFHGGIALLGLVCPGRLPFENSPDPWTTLLNQRENTLDRPGHHRTKFQRPLIARINRCYGKKKKVHPHSIHNYPRGRGSDRN